MNLPLLQVASCHCASSATPALIGALTMTGLLAILLAALATHAGPAAVTRSGVDKDQFLRAFNLSAFVPPGMKRRGQKRLPKKPEMLAQA